MVLIKARNVRGQIVHEFAKVDTKREGKKWSKRYMLHVLDITVIRKSAVPR